MNRVRTLGGVVALAGVTLLTAVPAWADDTSPTPTLSVNTGPTSPSPSPTVTSAPADDSPIVALPRAVASTTTVAPLVTAKGHTVTASGTGCATVHVVVDGPPDGWYSVPPRYLDRTVSATGGTWRTTFPMPALASTLDITCTDPGSTDGGGWLIAPAWTPGVAGWITRADHGLLSLDVSDAMDPLPTGGLFTETGRPVPYSVSATGAVLFRAPVGAVSVTVIGWHFLGENAEAVNTQAVDSFTALLPVAATPTPTPSPSTTTTGDGLAPSGGPGPLVLVGLLLLATGTALTLRRRA